VVKRHLNLVYSSALRRVQGSHSLAEEVTQKVFTDLAAKASHLTHHRAITGWLYCATKYATIDVVRAEIRRQRLAQSFSTMSSTSDASSEWERLRPLIDEALDRLKTRDREIVLLRFFERLTFADVGGKLGLSENAARMRTDRALAKLQAVLKKRGFGSTASMAAMLTAESVVAAPQALLTRVAATAAAAAPSGIIATLFNHLLLSQVATSAGTGMLVVGITLGCLALRPSVTASDLARLRTENTSLRSAIARDSNDTNRLTARDELSSRALQVVDRVHQVLGKNTSGNGTHRNYGLATPRNAFLSYVWAADAGDVSALSKIFTYDEKGRAIIQGVYIAMPPSMRAQYNSPEELMAFLFIAHTLLNPMPGNDAMEQMTAKADVVERGPGRVELMPHGQAHGLLFLQTPEGWRPVLPAETCEKVVTSVLENEMLAKLGLH
jgi:RNA polymerase sigma factor (sigma-70 family)